MTFQISGNYLIENLKYKIDEDEKKYITVNTRWFTNLDIKKRHEDMILFRKYNPEDYPKYDNYDAININKTVDIPIDYDGVMGLPITFLDKYNPEQFEIYGLANSARYIGDLPCLTKDKDGTINGKATYARILVRKKHQEVILF